MFTNPLFPPSPLSRYNCCVMAYGQTGSGKTYTMLGPTNTDGVPSYSGVIPNVMSEVQREADREKKKE